ncbi:hypothetical protein GOP47_0011053 [Adiantum capillus-veneris]|uniref:Uncharacterized protein n=1 Tax=Adiantum capillus-veneris TaxID=13818 RepID=A0A9D4USF6_ADICA|nr:hypothetical protein GOP47_0011053 [Adiantum capillus-veneris]
MAQAVSHDEVPHYRRFALPASMLFLFLLMLVSLRLMIPSAWLLRSDHGSSTQQGATANLNKSGVDQVGSYFSDVGTLEKQGMRMLLAENPAKVRNSLEGRVKGRSREGMQKDQPGSRPPVCHNECPRCQGGACVARPSFSRGVSSGSSVQRAVWTCACLHA